MKSHLVFPPPPPVPVHTYPFIGRSASGYIVLFINANQGVILHTMSEGRFPVGTLHDLKASSYTRFDGGVSLSND